MNDGLLRIARIAALVLATLAILFLLWQFSSAVVIFILSLAVAAAFGPLTQRLKQAGFPAWAALAVPYIIVLLIIAAVFLVSTGPLIDDLQQVSDDLIGTYDRTRLAWMSTDSSLLNSLANQMPSTQDLFGAVTGEESGVAIQAAFGAAENIFAFIGRLAIILSLSIYWSADQVRFERLALSLMPVEWRARARRIWQEVETGAGAFLRRELTLSFIAGIFLWLGYELLGLEYNTLLAFTGALARLIPWVGPILVIIFPLLVGISAGWWIGIASALYTLLALILLEIMLSRYFFPRSKYSSLLLVIIVIVLVDSYGLLGAVFGPPLAVTLQIFFENLLFKQPPSVPAVTKDTATDLRGKMEAIKQKVAALDGPRTTEIASLSERLELLVEKSIVTAQAEQNE